MKAKKKKKEGGGAPGWMVTYGDMMSLLLTFFVMLLSYSSTDIFKFKQAMGSLRGALGVMKSEQGVVNISKLMIGTRAQQQVETSTVRLKKLIKQEHMEEAISVERTDKGLLIRISSPVLFDLGKAEVKPDIRSILGKLVDIISKWEGPVRVEGHTDDLPIRTAQFPSNWELSAARAVKVLRYIIEKGGMAPKYLSAVGYGEHHPFVPNTDPESRSKNRRVVIHLEMNPDPPARPRSSGREAPQTVQEESDPLDKTSQPH
ncbi:MAG: OmpA family protein [Candidatus Latescibacteria bacterium]|nr:OmpA family protein [Candidatus Latescibacterota bacterium]MCK5527842.1 OmpA family protein [Candidatus Latescibacterota bacterium]